MNSTANVAEPARTPPRTLPPEVNILLVLVGSSLVFEVLG